ncbi:hypothetical protein [Erinnyis ello granulovirus]|uniref:Uncharacterized protein n=1 Tax=Erinnyis ello granulovirus TaxID=307444 RepID=A0A097DAF6_9BBAC|nr:hypothetical protein [Erinnyis ello granulovirus]AIS92009.1 hypothetical protein [Erinnyis ello granulovirus]
MLKIGKAKSLDEVDILFQIPNSYNSCAQYAYKIIHEEENGGVGVKKRKTKVVTGLDLNKPIGCVFSFNPQETAFVLSMFRATQLYPDIVERAKVNVVKVVTRECKEYWYVLGVKKGSESAGASTYQKMRVKHLEYNKLTCYMSGNVPVDLLRAFNTKIKNKYYLHSFLITSPIVETESGTVELVKETNSTA